MAVGGHDSKPPRDLNSVGSFVRAQGGVIYGWIASSAEAAAEPSPSGDAEVVVEDTAVEIFVNGLYLGAAVGRAGPRWKASKGEELDFSLQVPASLVISAPAVVRGRISGTDFELSSPLEYAGEDELAAALVAARGEVFIKDGMVRGLLKDVNPDALPLRLICYVAGRPTERAEVPKPRVSPPNGQAIAKLPFSMALPVRVLDGTGTTISVRAEGSDADLDGSPLVISITMGDSLQRRLSALEALTETLDKRSAGLSASIVKDVAEQFHRFVVPRVDAIVEVQRNALEAQMAALWKLTSGQPRPLLRRDLPRSRSFRLVDPFVGFGWSDPRTVGGGEERFFSRNAFLALDIAPSDALLVKVGGTWTAGDAGSEDLQLTANGRPAQTLLVRDRRSWTSLAILDGDWVSNSGALSVLISSERESFHPLGGDAVSASVGFVEVGPAPHEAGDGDLSVDETPAAFVAGWHGREVGDDRRVFQWMTGHGVVFIHYAGVEPLRTISLTGPMAFGGPDGALDLSASFNGEPLLVGAAEPRRPDWSFRFDFPTPLAGPVRGLLSLRTPTHEVAGDSRELGIAVSRIVFNEPGPGPTIDHADDEHPLLQALISAAGQEGG